MNSYFSGRLGRVFVLASASLILLLAACLEKEHFISCLRQVSRHWPSSGPRSYDDLVELRVRSYSCSDTTISFRT